MTATPDPRIIFTITLKLKNLSLSGLAAIPNQIVLDIGLAVRLCHKNVILK